MAKKICIYGILASLCIVLGYVESVVSLSFIAPGVKIGLANCVAVLLIYKNDIKGAFLVNIVRIILSTLLFSSPFSLIFSLSAGIISLLVMIIVKKLSFFGIVGLSVVGAVIHNTVQIVIAYIIFGRGVLYYYPVMLIVAAFSGTIIALIAKTILKKIKTNIKK